MRAGSLTDQTPYPHVRQHNPNLIIGVGLIVAMALTVATIHEPLFLFLPISIAVMMLAIAFAAGVLRGESFAVLALLSVAVFVLEAVFRVRDFTDKSIDWQVLLKAGSLLSLLAVAMFRMPITFPAIVSTTRVTWFVFFLWTCFTGLYAPNLAYSAFGAFSLVAIYLFLLYVFRTFDEVQIILSIIVATFAFCLVSIVVYYGMPEFGRMKEWHGNSQIVGTRLSGIGGNANTVGRQAALALLLLALYAPELKKINVLIVPVVGSVAAVALLLSNSRTSLALTLIIIWFLLFCTRERMVLFVLSLLALFVIMPFLFIFGETLLSMVSRSGDVAEITTGTGRTHIWAVVVQLIFERPVAGWGYGSTLFILPEYAGDIRHIAPHAHNMILQILITSGFVGLAIFAVAFGIRMFDAYRARNRTVLTLMAFVFLNGLTEASAFAGVANSATLAMLIAIALPLRTSPTSRLKN